MNEIDRRTYFAAHAPMDIPEWFVHKPSPKPKAPKLPKAPVGRHGSGALQRDFERYSDYEQRHTNSRGIDIGMYEMHGDIKREELEPIVDKLYAVVHKYHEAMEEWEKENELRRIGQWPWAWADLLLRNEE